jgi:histone acetyltransferase (RNA polymerase elongator complex component)
LQEQKDTFVPQGGEPGRARKKFYQRLYWKYTLYTSLQKTLQDELGKIVRKNENMQTFIIWKQPDLKSFRNFVSLDTRSREIRNKVETLKGGKVEIWKKIANLIIRKYESSVGEEYFVSFEDELGYLYGFTRLLLWEDAAMIRELHVYWNVETIKHWNNATLKQWNDKVQHTGFGKQLMQLAEQIAKKRHYKKISVISGIGVRAYYRKLGYKLEWTYMVKRF